MLAELANIVLAHARISFGTDVPELLLLSAQVICAFAERAGNLCLSSSR
jgi:hypothetical protein